MSPAVLFAVYVSAVLLALYVAGLQWTALGSLLVTLRPRSRRRVEPSFS